MADTGRRDIIYVDNILADERRRATLDILQKRGELFFWGMLKNPRSAKDPDYFLVEREPGQKEALTGPEIDRLAFDYVVALDKRISPDQPLNL